MLTLVDVNSILDAAQQEADANAWPVTIAIADDGVHLLGLRRLDSAAPFTASVATQQARSGGVPVIVDGHVTGNMGPPASRPSKMCKLPNCQGGSCRRCLITQRCMPLIKLPGGPMSIDLKLIIGTGTALIISTLLMVALNIFQMRGLLNRYLLNSARPASLKAVTNPVARDLQDPITASEPIASNHYLKDWFAPGEPEQSLVPATRYLDGVPTSQGAETFEVQIKAFRLDRWTGGRA